MKSCLLPPVVLVACCVVSQGCDERSQQSRAGGPGREANAPGAAASEESPIPAMRRMAFDYRLAPGTPSLADADDVHSLIVDWSVDSGTATIIAIADGAASIYFSSGGGIIGAGEREPVREEMRKVLSVAAKSRHLLQPGGGAEEAMPAAGRMRFTLVTDAGLLVGEASAEELESERHPLSELGNAVQRLIAAIRRTSPGGE